METVGPRVDHLIEVLLGSNDVEAAIVFGSQARAADDSPADAGSDVDMQVVVKNPERWIESAWAESTLPDGCLQAWNVRDAFGGVKKISILLTDGELDLVFVPAYRMRWARWGMALGIHRISAQGMRKLGYLHLLVDHGHCVVKGGRRWESFWQRVLTEVVEPRLSIAEIRNLLEGEKVDRVSIQRKLARGELIAAQRWLHTGIAEAVFKLIHELRCRQGKPSFHDGRRAESIWTSEEVTALRLSARCEAAEIEQAAEQGLQVAQRLVAELEQTFSKDGAA